MIEKGIKYQNIELFHKLNISFILNSSRLRRFHVQISQNIAIIHFLLEYSIPFPKFYMQLIMV